MLYYIAIDGRRIGPLSESQLRQYPVTPDTLVWYNGLADWTSARNVPEINRILSGQTVPPAMPVSGDSAPYAAQNVPQYGSGQYGDQNAANIPPCPSSNIALAILSTICCCLPLGIVAIVYASRVQSLYMSHRYEEAYDSSAKARKWSIAAIIVGIVVSIAQLIWMFAVGGSALDPEALREALEAASNS